MFQISESMSTGTTYYSNTVLTKNLTDLTADDGFVFKPRIFDSVTSTTIDGDIKLKPQIRAPLDNLFGQLLLNKAVMGDFPDNASFQNFFNGIYITTENTTGLLTNEGNILNFKMGESKITLYYHNTKVTNSEPMGLLTNDTLSYDFSLGSVARFNHFEHNYNEAILDIKNQIGTSALAQNGTVYVQSMAGVKTKVEFPYLMNWVSNGAIGINKAELVISVDTSVYKMLETFPTPSALILFGINDDGTTYAIPDAFEGATYFGGTYNSGTVQYKFNIARYIQQIVDGDRKNNGLYILASNGAVFGNRAVLGGATSATRPMKLNITYTKIY